MVLKRVVVELLSVLTNMRALFCFGFGFGYSSLCDRHQSVGIIHSL